MRTVDLDRFALGARQYLDAARAAADRKDLAKAEEPAPGLAERLAHATR
ncbi:hypothetical protein [Streptomyces chartreusis]